ncbi:uncharacterized protein DMAD_02334 [Drosophila madeirensis]|uniref:Uncharacterized protein n=1 Tax=Drosophila madeirensis TaxID=30013 RepID=A0AAU9G4X2_DROMD
MFFGPAHTLTQYSSLPRRSHMHGHGAGPSSSGAAFQRNTPIRRSTGIPEHHMEYFVPRSISEFNLSGVGDLALPPPRRYSPNMGSNMGMGMGMGMGTGMGMGMGMGMGLPHGLQLGPPQTLLCGGGPQQQQQQQQQPPPPPAQLQIVTLKPRSEKMVTFEDESKQQQQQQQPPPPSIVSSGVNSVSAASGTHCPHGVPTTPRKSSAVGGLGGGDIFM